MPFAMYTARELPLSILLPVQRFLKTYTAHNSNVQITTDVHTNSATTTCFTPIAKKEKKKTDFPSVALSWLLHPPLLLLHRSSHCETRCPPNPNLLLPTINADFNAGAEKFLATK
jgi:hypothetical protein